VFTKYGAHITGKIWGYRIPDTLGLLGALPLFMIPLFAYRKFFGQNNDKKWLILLLGLLPFIVYCIPLLNFVWLSNCNVLGVYYRVCYSSLFWLPLTLVLSNFGEYLHGRFSSRLVAGSWVGMNSLYVLSIFLFLVLLSSIQSAPLYGKLDFLTVNSRSWWGAWRPMIEKVLLWKKADIETDYITGYVLGAIFNVPVRHAVSDPTSIDQTPKRTLESMVSNSMDERSGCLINLHPFQPTWVPQTTGHWSAKLANPMLLYRVDNKAIGSVRNYVQEEPLGKCYLYK
jgi:hypothetical protein